ncbi:MAG: hypothetical protein MHMPM18_000919 [Marteilia pararefringens]
MDEMQAKNFSFTEDDHNIESSPSNESEEMDEILENIESTTDGEFNSDEFNECGNIETNFYVISKDGEKWFHIPSICERRKGAENIFRSKVGFSKHCID